MSNSYFTCGATFKSTANTCISGWGIQRWITFPIASDTYWKGGVLHCLITTLSLAKCKKIDIIRTWLNLTNFKPNTIIKGSFEREKIGINY